MRSVQKKIYSDIGRCCNKLKFIVTCDLHRFYTNWKVVLRLQPKSSQILTIELNMLFIGTSMWGISPYGRLKRGQKWRTKFSQRPVWDMIVSQPGRLFPFSGPHFCLFSREMERVVGWLWCICASSILQVSSLTYSFPMSLNIGMVKLG